MAVWRNWEAFRFVVKRTADGIDMISQARHLRRSIPKRNERVLGGKSRSDAVNLIQTIDAGPSFATDWLMRLHNGCLKISCEDTLTLVEVEVVLVAIAVNDHAL